MNNGVDDIIRKQIEVCAKKFCCSTQNPGIDFSVEKTIHTKEHKHKKHLLQTSPHQQSTLTMTSNTTVTPTVELLSKINIEDLLNKVNDGDNQSKDFAVAVLTELVNKAKQEVVVLEIIIVCCFTSIGELKYVFFVIADTPSITYIGWFKLITQSGENGLVPHEINMINEGLTYEAVSAETLEKEVLQREMYESLEVEAPNADTVSTMKRYLRTVYKDVKFFADIDKDYDEPNFVTPSKTDENGNEVKSQTVQIVNYLLENLGMYCSLTIYVLRLCFD